ncbi:MAG: hypothetical protein CMJ59_21635 [Planctomycetaceae bacterium]|nr:hypothetical protein [Planctomycetaceae bacterium]
MTDHFSSPQHDHGPSNRWWILSLVALAYFVLIQHRSLVFYVQVPLSAELSLTKLQAGLLDTAFLIPYSIAQLFVAYLSDRLQRRRVLAFSLLASALALIAMGFVNSFFELLALRITLGFAQAASVPAIAGVMADCFTPRNRSTAIGIYNLSLNLAFIVVGLFGGLFADLPNVEVPFASWGWGPLELAGWRMAMLCFGLLGVAAAAGIFFVMPEPIRTERESDRGLGTQGAALHVTIGSVLKVPAFWMLAMAFVFFCMVANAQDFWLARYFVEEFGMTNQGAGQFATVWSRPATIAGLLLGGYLADRFSRRRRAGRTLIQVVGITLWIPALLVMGMFLSREWLIVAMVTYGLGYGFYVANLWTTTFEVIDPAARSTAVGLLNVIGIGAAPTSPLIGYLVDKGILGLGQAIAGLSLLAATIVVFLALNAVCLLRRPEQEPEPAE